VILEPLTVMDSKCRIILWYLPGLLPNRQQVAQLLIKDLGLTLEYSTGMVVGFCGSILQHEVRSSGNSDRVCYVHFMQESVRKRLDVPLGGWVNCSLYNLE
jgi:hypothetical protein